MGSVQIGEGRDAGGILGWFDHQSTSRFVYAEAAGYYLSFLEFVRRGSFPHAHAEMPLLSSRAGSTAQWISRRWLAHPLTRTYLDEQHTRDWRNSFAFSFDQAMMLRGVSVSAALVDEEALRPLASELCGRLSAFIGDGGLLLPCLAAGSHPIPQHWSTRQGPYQVKAAAAALSSGALLPAPLRASSRKTFDHWASFNPEVIVTAELHPLLYFVEGLLLGESEAGGGGLAAHPRSVLERILWHLLETPELEQVRSDVIAQTLRLGCLFAGSDASFRREYAPALRKLAQALVQLIGADGAVYFRRNRTGQLEHANVWCGIFTAQALWCYSWLLRDVPFPSAALDWLA